MNKKKLLKVATNYFIAKITLKLGKSSYFLFNSQMGHWNNSSIGKWNQKIDDFLAFWRISTKNNEKEAQKKSDHEKRSCCFLFSWGNDL